MRARVAAALIAIAAGAAGCGPTAAPPATPVTRPPAPTGPIPNPTFPLALGASWTYQGTIRWADAKRGEPREAEVTWQSEVIDVIDRGSLVAYLLRGHPADLVWSEGEAQRGDWAILRVRDRAFHLARATPDFVAKLRASDDAAALAAPSDRFVELPLHDGQRICKDPEEPEYCWEVEAIDSSIFRLTYRTRPDHTVIEFVSGKGVVAYRYAHHGTLAEVDVRLVEYVPGK